MSESTGHFVDTLWTLVQRDIKTRYKGSALGILWALLTPLGTVAVFQFVFTRVIDAGVQHFPVFLYCGILPWTWFQSSLQFSSSVLQDNRDLVRTPFFSKPLLPWTVTCTNFAMYLLALPVLILLMVWQGIPVTSAVVMLPAVWFTQWVLSIGFAMLMASIGIVIRDWQHLISVLLVFWFYLTPIFYDVATLPKSVAPWFALNPMTTIVEAHRAIIMLGRAPDWVMLGSVLAAGVVLSVVSLVVFRALEESFVDRA
ncbi:MAG: ABC transporter permease [Vicinamibacterales bacterium]